MTKLLLLLTASAALLSYGWAMPRFFKAPGHWNRGMATVTGLGMVFGFVHVLALLLSPAPTPLSAGVALGMYLGSLGIFWWAIASHREGTPASIYSGLEPEHLTVDGPYRYIRHPFYTAYCATWLAGFTATGQPLLLASFLVMGALYMAAAKTEEESFLQGHMAEAYAAYRARTGAVLPRLDLAIAAL